jgi:hypothetical protein
MFDAKTRGAKDFYGARLENLSDLARAFIGVGLSILDAWRISHRPRHEITFGNKYFHLLHSMFCDWLCFSEA